MSSRSGDETPGRFNRASGQTTEDVEGVLRQAHAQTGPQDGACPEVHLDVGVGVPEAYQRRLERYGICHEGFTPNRVDYSARGAMMGPNSRRISWPSRDGSSSRPSE